MKRQKIQRELMKLEQENLEKREEIVVKKDETPTKTRVTAVPKVSKKSVLPYTILYCFLFSCLVFPHGHIIYAKIKTLLQLRCKNLFSTNLHYVEAHFAIHFYFLN